MELADIDACWASHRQIASPRRTLVGVLCDRETEMNCAKPHAGCRNEDRREGTTKKKKKKKKERKKRNSDFPAKEIAHPPFQEIHI